MKRTPRGFRPAFGMFGSLGLFALSSLAGCSPKIGDDCTISTDCSIQGDRLCDPTQPGGYCTVFNCEPNRCPSEAVCVGFGEPSCSSAALSRRFLRTFCMLVCESNDDCRAGYVCVDTATDPLRKVVDQDPQSLRVCAVPSSNSPTSMPGMDPAICRAVDAGAGSGTDASAVPESGAETAPEGAASSEAETSSDVASEGAPLSSDGALE
jgi:hypothetical protein